MMSRELFQKVSVSHRDNQKTIFLVGPLYFYLCWLGLYYISISTASTFFIFAGTFFPYLSFSYNFTEIIKFKLVWQELFSCLFSRDPSHFFHPYFLQFHLHEIMSHCRDYFFYQIFHLKPNTGSVNAGMTADILAI